MARKEKYIEVGVTAMRDPVTGEMLPAVPLYVKAKGGAEEAEQSLYDDLGKLFAYHIREQMRGNQLYESI